MNDIANNYTLVAADNVQTSQLDHLLESDAKP